MFDGYLGEEDLEEPRLKVEFAYYDQALSDSDTKVGSGQQEFTLNSELDYHSDQSKALTTEKQYRSLDAQDKYSVDSSRQSLRYSPSVELNSRPLEQEMYFRQPEAEPSVNKLPAAANESTEEGMNFYEEVLEDAAAGQEDSYTEPRFGAPAGFQREFSLEQLQPVSSEQDSSEEDPSEEKFAPVFESAGEPEANFKKPAGFSREEPSETARELRETVKYLVGELQEAKKRLEAAERRAAEAWEEGVRFGREQQQREQPPAGATFDEESMSSEIRGLKRLLEESERVRKELQSRLVGVSEDFDRKAAEVKAQLQARAAAKDLALERQVAELQARTRMLQEELDRARSASDKQRPAPRQIKFNKDQGRTTPELSPAQRRTASKSPPPKPEHQGSGGSKRSPSPAPSPAAVAAYLETIHKLELENKKLKDHLRVVLHSPKNTNLAAGPAGPATPDLPLLTSLLLKTDPSLLVVPINDTTLEVNKRRVVLVLHNGKTMVKGKHTLLTLQEFVENYKK